MSPVETSRFGESIMAFFRQKRLSKSKILFMKSDFTKEEVVDMARTAGDMDKKAHTKHTVFSRLKPADCEHLKPLSLYSRLITDDKNVSPNQFSSPFVNFKIEILNNCAKKRKLDHSGPDDGHEEKKVFCPRALSPDQGCFVDSSSPPARQDSVSSFAMSKPAILNKTDDSGSEMACGTSGQSEHVERGSSTESGDNKGTVPHSTKCENVAPVFDCDVDDILCLNPFDTHNVRPHPDNVESCSLTFQNQPISIPNVAHGEKFRGEDGQVEEERKEVKKEVCVDEKDVEEDKGYFSMSYIKDLKTGKDPSQSYTQPPSTSSPLPRIGDFGAAECPPKSSFELACHKQAELSGQHVDDFSSVVTGSLLESAKPPREILEGDVEEVWDIGPPILESSVCHNVTVKLNGSEQSRQVSEEVQGGVLQSVHECQSTDDREELTLDTSYETTLPLQVQVKSVIVCPTQQSSSSKQAAPPLPKPSMPNPKEDRVSQTGVGTARSQRPVTYHREVDLERDKRMYLHSVTRHMSESPGEGRDAMVELMKLMTHVADQTPGTNGRQWQHPSDLTRRNYQRRFANTTPTMTLHEWKAKNYPTYKRFGHIPKIFQRSPFP